MRLICAAVFAVAAIGSAQAASCVVESEELAPYHVLGTLVQPQSNVVAIGECDKSYSELDRAYLAADKAGTTSIIFLSPSYGYGIHCESHLNANSTDSTLDASCQ